MAGPLQRRDQLLLSPTAALDRRLELDRAAEAVAAGEGLQQRSRLHARDRNSIIELGAPARGVEDSGAANRALRERELLGRDLQHVLGERQLNSAFGDIEAAVTD